MDPIYLSITLFLVGVTLIFLDLFVPSGATLLIMGIVSTIASILFAFQVDGSFGMLMLTLSLAAIPVALFLAIKVWPRTYIGKRVILQLPKDKNADSSASSAIEDSFPVGEVFKLDAPLLPSGAVRLNNRLYNLVAEAGAIEAQVHVEVLFKRGREFIVKPTDRPATISKGLRPQARQANRNVETQEGLEGGLLETPADSLGLDSIDSSLENDDA